MFRFTLLLLLPLIICVTGQEGFNQSTRRSRPLPLLGRPRSIRPGQSSSPPTPPPVVATTQSAVTAATQPPQVVSAPQVIIQVVTGGQTPVAPALTPTAVNPSQSAVIKPLSPVASVPEPAATENIQPPAGVVSSLSPPEVPQVSVKPMEDVVDYETQPKLELATETNPKPALEPEVETKLTSQPVPNQPQSEIAPAGVEEISASPYSYPLEPQVQFAPVIQAASVESAPLALPPLLPKPKPIREPVFGRQTAPTTKYPITISTQRVTKAPPVVMTTSTTQKPGSLKLDLVCKNGNGFYAVDNECDSYIECKYNKGIQRWCPDGLHFNPAAKRNEYPCAYPSVVKCTAGKERQNPNPTAQCPRQYGFFATNDGDCTKFVVCQEGLATIMSCPAGLVFNPTVQSCDWLENVPQCNPNVFKNYVCPEPPLDENGLVSDIIYRYRYEQQCNLYIACHRGFPRLLSCDRGLSFHEGSQSCIDEEYVQDCAIARSYDS